MKIELKEVTVRDLVKGYRDNEEEGVVGYNGLLDIRPPFQREFVYKDDQRNAVIDTVKKGYPLNVHYWTVTGKDDEGNTTYEVLDGQQRTLSLAQFITSPGGFSIPDADGYPQFFHTLDEDEQEKILNYPLQVYVCDGSSEEKLEWFKTINVAGEKLNAQELRNAVFAGPWLSDAKKKFSKNQCVAYQISKMYVKGSPIRQDFLATALTWISYRDDIDVEEYMEDQKYESTADELWNYFRSVIEWVNDTFITYDPSMKGVDWGRLYNLYSDERYDAEFISSEMERLLEDEDVTRKQNIYGYLLGEGENGLGIRGFTQSMKRAAYERQEHECVVCCEKKPLADLVAEHEIAWVDGGETSSDNCVLRCDTCTL